MEPLATPDDVAARLGRDMTIDELVRLDALLADASTTVRKAARQQFTHGTSTITLVTNGKRARLPQRPVIEVTSVKDLSGNDMAYQLVNDVLRFDITPLNWFEVEPYRCFPTEIVVEYEHGYRPTDDEPPVSTIPDDIVAVVCSVVCRALGMNPTAPGGIAQESIDGYSITAGGGTATASVIAQGALGLLPSEQAICDSYWRPASPIPT